MSIRIKNTSIRRFRKDKTIKINKVLRAMHKSISEIKVARDTNRFRQSLYEVVRDDFIREMAKGKRIIETTITNDHISRAVHYAGAHTRGHPDFNKDYAGGYKNPTLVGSKPLELPELNASLQKNIQEAFPK